MTDATERERIQKLAADGEEALAEVFSEYERRLRKIVEFRIDRRLWGRLDEADVLQEVYLTAARCLGDYLRNPAVPVFVWLRAMAQNTLVDVHRRHFGAQKRDARRDVPLHRRGGASSASISIAASLAASLTSPSKAAVRADRRQQLYDALETMDSVDREVLALRHFEDLSNGEVAQVLGLKKAAASNRYIRALKRLKEILVDMGLNGTA